VLRTANSFLSYSLWQSDTLSFGTVGDGTGWIVGKCKVNLTRICIFIPKSFPKAPMLSLKLSFLLLPDLIFEN
jgi:hypothetical protein